MDLNHHFTNDEFEPIDEGLANRIEKSHFTKPVLVMIWKQILLHFFVSERINGSILSSSLILDLVIIYEALG